MAKKYHNVKCKSIKFKVDNKVYLNLHQKYKLSKNNSHCKLEVQYTDPHKMLKWVNNLAYWLELPETIWIHNIVLMTQLKPHPEVDPYEREFKLNPDSVEKQDSNSYYKIDTVINKKMIYRSLWYKIKWTRYDPEKNTWLWPDDIQMKDLIQEYKEKQHQTINKKDHK